MTVQEGIPVTTVPRTILDLAAVAPRRVLENALHEAEYLRLRDKLSVPDLLARYPGRRGTATLHTIFAERTISITHDELEARFLTFLGRTGLPRPELNVPMHLGDRFIEADCVWREQRVIAELDGRAAHDRDRAFEGDRARDRALLVRHWRVVRITWRQLHDRPAALAADLRGLLGGYASPP